MSDVPNNEFGSWEQAPSSQDMPYRGNTYDWRDYEQSDRQRIHADRVWIPYQERDVDPMTLRRMMGSQNEQRRTVREEFELKVNSILTLLAQSTIDDESRQSLHNVLLDQALTALTTVEAGVSIGYALDRADIKPKRLVQYVMKEAATYRGDRVEDGHLGWAILQERTRLLNTLSFEPVRLRERAKELMVDFQNHELLFALLDPDGVSPAWMERWQTVRNQLLARVETFSKELLLSERQNDPVDVARILWVITANPSLHLIDDSVSH